MTNYDRIKLLIIAIYDGDRRKIDVLLDLPEKELRELIEELATYYLVRLVKANI